MNDDWDGLDWAEHFSRPDDNEIKQIVVVSENGK
jgi:hypothetical protein